VEEEPSGADSKADQAVAFFQLVVSRREDTTVLGSVLELRETKGGIETITCLDKAREGAPVVIHESLAV